MKKFTILFLVFFISVVARPLDAEAGACYNMDQAACEAFHRSNQERMKNRLPALAYCGRCYSMAAEHSADMATIGFFDHHRPNSAKKSGETFGQRAKRYGLEKGVGENLARTRTAKSAVDRWMQSPGHRKNILNPAYDSFAVAHVNGYYTQVFRRTPRTAQRH
jgi:uncharacterized protein YkwD